MTIVVLLLLATLWLWLPRGQDLETPRKTMPWWCRKPVSGGKNPRQRALSMDSQLLRELAALLRSGLMFPQAVEALLRVRKEQCPVLAELQRLDVESKLLGRQAPAPGQTQEVGIESSVQRLTWCLDLSHHTGAPLAGVLEHLAEDLEAELLALQSFDAAMAGPRATARLLTWLPVAGLSAGFLLGIDVGRALLTSWAAQLSVVIGVGLWVINRIWCRRLLAVATEQALK